MDGQTTSPTPTQIPVTNELSFYDALREIIAEKKITKLEWENPNIYCYLITVEHNQVLTIHKDDNKDYNWILTDADITGTDWVLV
jgi:CDP-diacylglycerol pyrophosphatase